jgi:hypothetical protein
VRSLQLSRSRESDNNKAGRQERQGVAKCSSNGSSFATAPLSRAKSRSSSSGPRSRAPWSANQILNGRSGGDGLINLRQRCVLCGSWASDKLPWPRSLGLVWHRVRRILDRLLPFVRFLHARLFPVHLRAQCSLDLFRSVSICGLGERQNVHTTPLTLASRTPLSA